ncbi:MAG: alpha/beta fold hydrolase [Acidimicrobiia bacterium]
MPTIAHGPATLHYDDEGQADGFPVFLIAPGGMRSANDFWLRMPWNPRAELADGYRVIGMDQRNTGSSFAPVTGDESWATFAADQLAVLDHLGVERCHVIGMCIGGPYVAGLLKAAPNRFASAVMLQPVGIDANTDTFNEMFDGWVNDVRADHPEATDAMWASFKRNMWSGEFLLTMTRDDVAACDNPLLVMMGNDIYHPQSTSREIAGLAPKVTFVERWKDDDVLAQTDATIKRFLAQNTPTL